MFSITNLCIHTREKNLVNHLSFIMQAGERWVVLGANGCGKSSLLQACAGLPTTGRTVHFDQLSFSAQHLLQCDRRSQPTCCSKHIARTAVAHRIASVMTCLPLTVINGRGHIGWKTAMVLFAVFALAAPLYVTKRANWFCNCVSLGCSTAHLNALPIAALLSRCQPA
jgi:ABC-type glutathione transport system ATPase component